MVRLGVRAVVLLAAALVVYLAVTFVQVWQASRRDEARQVQAIVVFGAAQYAGRPSAVLRARLDHAAALYERGVAKRVVVMGGKADGDLVTEATAAATYLGKKGIADSAILREVSGRTSWQSLASAASFMKQRGITKVVLVSDGFHAARIAAMADELGLEGYTSPTRSSPIRGVGALPYLGKETLEVATGRLVGFRRMEGIDRTVRGSRARTLGADGATVRLPSGG